MARSDVALVPPPAPAEEGQRSAVAVKEQRIFVASQWQLMWWRFRKHKVALASARRRRWGSTWPCSAPTSSPTPTPTPPRPSAR